MSDKESSAKCSTLYVGRACIVERTQGIIIFQFETANRRVLVLYLRRLLEVAHAAFQSCQRALKQRYHQNETKEISRSLNILIVAVPKFIHRRCQPLFNPPRDLVHVLTRQPGRIRGALENGLQPSDLGVHIAAAGTGLLHKARHGVRQRQERSVYARKQLGCCFPRPVKLAQLWRDASHGAFGLRCCL